MSLSQGSRLGPYEVTGTLGAGGMGEVYRGHDGRLKRDVALKILPASLAADPDRLARFEREAQALASMNHPNIAAIYGLEEGQGVRALVLELVEGETLAERIGRGKLSVTDAMGIARQIASALEVAHEQGIVHRDLKPANIKITPDGIVKVLDFGLAKLTQTSDSGLQASGSGLRDAVTGAPTGVGFARPEVTASPTMTSPALMTGAGVLLGTAAYMSPEQARGKAVNKRADIWAFGVVLYEMLTGTRAFGGESVTETAGAVIHKELDWNALPSDLPPAARTILRRCLEKDPAQRVRDMGDARLGLDGAFTPDGQVASERAGRRRVVEVAAAALVAALATGAGVWTLTRDEPPVPPFPVRLEIPSPGPNRMGPIVSLSPDGRNVLYLANDDTSMPRVWIHSMESGASRVLTAAGAVNSPPFWSPDGRFIAFGADGKLKRIAVAGGPAETLCDVGNFTGGTWTRDDVIVFADQTKGGLWRVPARGGTPVQITVVDKARKEGGQFLPWALPDGRHFLYLRAFQATSDVGIYIGDVDAAPEQQNGTRLLAAVQGAVYVPGRNATGWLLYMRERLLMAQAFDERSLRLGGEPSRLAEVGSFQIIGSFSASSNGTLAYLSATSDSGSMVWVDRNGTVSAHIASGLKNPQNPRLSPNGRSLAAVVAGDVWTYDVAGRPPVKVTFDGNHYSPIWTPDGTQILYEAGGARGLATVPADGSGGTPAQFGPLGHFHAHGWTAGGKDVVSVRMPGGDLKSADLVRFASSKDATVDMVVATPANEGMAGSVSPDGRWLAYSSDSTGKMEIWVRPLPGPGAAVRVSPNTGFEPVWSRNGRELFYVENNTVMVVAVDTANGFDFEPPTRLFEEPTGYVRSQQPPSYDVAADGRFVMVKSDAASEVPITVILNWTGLLNTGATATH